MTACVASAGALTAQGCDGAGWGGIPPKSLPNCGLHLVACLGCQLGHHPDPSITPGCDSRGNLCNPGSSWKSLPAMGLLVAPDSHGYPHTPAAITVLATVEHSLPSQAWQPWLPWAITALPTLETQGLSSDPYSPPCRLSWSASQQLQQIKVHWLYTPQTKTKKTPMHHGKVTSHVRWG